MIPGSLASAEQSCKNDFQRIASDRCFRSGIHVANSETDYWGRIRVRRGVEVVGVFSHGPRVPGNAGWPERPVALVAMCSPDTVLRTLAAELRLPTSEDCDQRRTREGYQVPLIHDVD